VLKSVVRPCTLRCQPWVERLVGILHDRATAARFDQCEPSGAVVAHAGEHHPDDVDVVRDRSGLEQNIDGRPVTVLPRPEA